MKPVAIFRHARSEGPAYFATYLERRAIPWKLFALDEGRAVPKDVRRFSGLVFMGGPMSVNDDLPWIKPLLELVREAVRKDVPALGHCLGGQLMSKALGGEVTRARVKEIGWGEVEVADNGVAREWFGAAGRVRVLPLARRDLQHSARRARACSATRTAPTRPSRSASTSACSATSR